jgi:hypothetical protein
MSDQQNKKDGGKLRPSLLPWSAVNAILDVLEFGAKKYAPHSWAKVEPDRYVEALLRHAIEFGERHRTEGILCKDAESGLPTLAHLACNAVFLLAHPARVCECGSKGYWYVGINRVKYPCTICNKADL